MSLAPRVPRSVCIEFYAIDLPRNPSSVFLVLFPQASSLSNTALLSNHWPFRRAKRRLDAKSVPYAREKRLKGDEAEKSSLLNGDGKRDGGGRVETEGKELIRGAALTKKEPPNEEEIKRIVEEIREAGAIGSSAHVAAIRALRRCLSSCEWSVKARFHVHWLLLLVRYACIRLLFLFFSLGMLLTWRLPPHQKQGNAMAQADHYSCGRHVHP